jgi:putative flippase GtrA
MKMATWLRVSAGLSLLLALAHTSGGLQHWSPPGETDVLRSMDTFHFDALGSQRSYLDFYLGFGYVVSLYMFAQSLLLWQMASLARSSNAKLRPMVATFLAVGLGASALGWALFFLLPAVSNLAISICLALAWIAGRREEHHAGR